MVIMISSYKPLISLHVQMQRAWVAVPDTDSHVTCSTDTDSRVTCSKKYGFLLTACSYKASPLTSIHLCELDVWLKIRTSSNGRLLYSVAVSHAVLAIFISSRSNFILLFNCCYSTKLVYVSIQGTHKMFWKTHIPYSGKLSGRKLSRFCGYSLKFSLGNLEVWYPLAQKFSLRKSIFHQFAKVSLSLKVFRYPVLFSLGMARSCGVN